jgi:hypothetical protein
LTAASGDLAAAELAVPRNLPPLAQALASDASGAPMVFSARRGLGAVIVSGALDAWRYRDSHRFDEFWRTAILGEAITAPPRLGVSVTPGVARPGDRVRITARLRPTELRASGNEIALPAASARAVAPGLRLDQPVRLWPATEPGVYEGEWTAAAAGDYAIDVSIGALTAAAVLSVDRRAAMPPGRNEVLAVAARVSGGDVFADDAALIAGLTSRHPASTAWRPARPARTIWWAAAFSVLLSIEWALRRRRGQA